METMDYEVLDDPITKSFQEVCKYTKPEIKLLGTVMTKDYVRYAKIIRDMEVRPDDTWIIGIPRSGTTWTQEMVWLLRNELNIEKAKSVHSCRRILSLEYVGLYRPEELEKFQIENSVENVIDEKSPRFIRSHLTPDLLPKQLFEVNPKIIYINRNPKDAAVSMYHHFKLWKDYTGTKELFFEAYMQGSIVFGPYWDHVLSFWNMRNKKNLLILSYEDLKRDLSKELKRLAEFLEVKYSKEQEQPLLDYLSFNSMKQNPAVNLEEGIKALGKEGQSFIRKGVVEGWKSDMSEEMSERFDKWITENLKGSDFQLRTC